MRTIAFVTQKGGAGKSTLATNVAVAASLSGERVFLLDLDGSQSAASWSKIRGKSDVAVESVPPAKLVSTLETLEKKGVTLVVIDAPGAIGVEFDAAMRVADLCVIPARPNAFDLWASERTRARVKAAGKDHAFLLNQCPPAQQSHRVEQGAKVLQAMGALLSPLVTARVDYQEAARAGLSVVECNPHGVAAREMQELWSCLKRRLKKTAEVSKPRAIAAQKPVAAAAKVVRKAA
jgi:chromosome partitioning protein